MELTFFELLVDDDEGGHGGDGLVVCVISAASGSRFGQADVAGCRQSGSFRAARPMFHIRIDWRQTDQLRRRVGRSPLEEAHSRGRAGGRGAWPRSTYPFVTFFYRILEL